MFDYDYNEVEEKNRRERDAEEEAERNFERTVRRMEDAEQFNL